MMPQKSHRQEKSNNVQNTCTFLNVYKPYSGTTCVLLDKNLVIIIVDEINVTKILTLTLSV